MAGYFVDDFFTGFAIVLLRSFSDPDEHHAMSGLDAGLDDSLVW
jgi:hypothetical protein